MLFDSFCGRAYKSLSGQITTDRAVNLYTEQVQSGTGKAHFCLLSAPGTRAFATLAGGPIRALASSIQGPGLNEYIVAVVGASIYKIDGLATATMLGGAVAFSGGAVASPAQLIPYAPNKLFLLSEGQGYVIDVALNTAVPVVLPVSFANSVTTLDTYMIISDVDSRNFYISAVGDPTSWNPLDVASKEGNPDFLQGVFAANELLFLYGLETTEIWDDSGAANFPFQRYPGGGVLEIGTTHIISVCKVGDAVMWVGRDARGTNVVYMARGLQYQRVSDHAVEAAINIGNLDGFDAGFAHSYQENGHFFYVLNSSNGIAKTTWVYDMTTNMWHERARWTGTEYTAQNWQNHTMAFYSSGPKGHYVGGTGVGTDTQGIIYYQAMNLFDFDGQVKRVMRVAPHLTGEQRRVRYDNVILDLDKTSNPVLNLRSSNDGGANYGVVHTITAPDRESRAIWRNLGSARDKVIEISSETACLQAWAACYVNEKAPAA